MNQEPLNRRNLAVEQGSRAINILRGAVACVVMVVLVIVPMPASAVELSSGVSLGAIQIGTVPRLAVSPNLGLMWRMDGGFIFTVHDLFNILPPRNRTGVGVYNHTSTAIGYAWQDGDLSAGPSLSIYSMVACGAKLCGRVAGLAPGGHAQVNVFFYGALGVSASVDVDWVGGRSLVLPGGVAAMVVAGPVIRWNSK
ncbi:MAG: hypothetical protein ABJE95_18860 [Byssovorax sp.]